MTAQSTDERLNIFINWLAENNITINKDLIEITSNKVEHGYGVISKKHMTVGTPVCQIPKTSVLSTFNSPLSSAVQEWFSDSENGKKGGSLALTFVLLSEMLKKEKSKWFGYLQILPSTVYLPVSWTNTELEYLKGSSLHSTVIRDRLLLTEDYENSFKPFALKNAEHYENAIPTYEQFLFASSLVSSRAFVVDKKHGDSMVPVADMFNHRSGSEHVHLEGDNAITTNEGKQDVLEMVIVQEINCGMELFNTFGDRPTTNLLVKYGFAEQNNPNKSCIINKDMVLKVLSNHQSESVLTKRLSFIDSHEDLIFEGSDPECFSIVADGSFCQPLMIMIYLIVTTDKQIRSWESDDVAFINWLQNVDMDVILNDKITEIVTELVISRSQAFLPANSKLQDDLNKKEALLAKLKRGEINKENERAFYCELFSVYCIINEREALRDAYHSLFDVSKNDEEEEKEDNIISAKKLKTE